MNTNDLLNLVMLAKATKKMMDINNEKAVNVLLDEYADAYEYVASERPLFAGAVYRKFKVNF